jgi:transformation/transcription domain-associated protein
MTFNRFTNSIYYKSGWSQANPLLGNGESVPFRFTPTIQDYITPVGVEGLFASCLMATARSLTEPELDLDQYLSLFIRDELITWHMSNHRSVTDAQFRERVQANVVQVMTKAQFLSCRVDRDKVRENLMWFVLNHQFNMIFFNRQSIQVNQ